MGASWEAGGGGYFLYFRVGGAEYIITLPEWGCASSRGTQCTITGFAHIKITSERMWLIWSGFLRWTWIFIGQWEKTKPETRAFWRHIPVWPIEEVSPHPPRLRRRLQLLLMGNLFFFFFCNSVKELFIQDLKSTFRWYNLEFGITIYIINSLGMTFYSD